MDQSAAQRLAHAEAVARRWKRRVESLALTDACDELSASWSQTPTPRSPARSSSGSATRETTRPPSRTTSSDRSRVSPPTGSSTTSTPVATFSKGVPR